MGKYAVWIALRWRTKSRLKSLLGCSARSLAQHLPASAQEYLRAKLVPRSRALMSTWRTLPGRILRQAARPLPVGARHYLRAKLLPGSGRPLAFSAATTVPAPLWEERAGFLDRASFSRERPESDRWPRRPKVTHVIGSLGPGGAERQLCNCVVGQRRLGLDVSVLVLYGGNGENNHYRKLLERDGIKVVVAGEHFDKGFAAALAGLPDIKDAVQAIPDELYAWSVDIFGELLTDKPQIVHCWLDHTNIWGGIAGLLARVPLVVLSTRNANPMHFPNLATPYFHAMYTRLAQRDNVRFINNSHAGAEDYAQWLGIPKERFSVVLNGVDLVDLQRADDVQVERLRTELRIPSTAPIIVGVFRLSDEKQPMIFLEVVRRVVARRPQVHAVIAGVGPLEPAMRDFIAAHDLTRNVRLLGRRQDVATLFTAASLTMLCSRMEGTPNVLLEAQCLGCPVVSTRAGGAIDTVRDGESGFLVEVGDLAALESAATRLIDDTELRRRFAEQGPPFIRQTFGVDRMIRETVAVYFPQPGAQA